MSFPVRRLLSLSLRPTARLLHTNNALTRLLSNLEDVYQSENVEKNKVARLLRDYKSDEKDWQSFALFTQEKYTRNLVRQCPGFCVMILAWRPGQASSIHNHSGSNCWVKMLDGELTETRYRQTEGGGGPVRTGQAVVRRDMVTYMDDSIGLHVIANNSPRPAVTLHIYSPPFDKCLAFDETTGEPRVSSCDFDSIKGKTNSK